MNAHVRTRIRLPRSLEAWNTPGFRDVLKREIEQLDAGQLPLQEALTSTSYALTDSVQVMVLSATADPSLIRARVGIFFSGITAGCSCADDPTPVAPQNEYCELRFDIDKATAEATVALVADREAG